MSASGLGKALGEEQQARLAASGLSVEAQHAILVATADFAGTVARGVIAVGAHSPKGEVPMATSLLLAFLAEGLSKASNILARAAS